MATDYPGIDYGFGQTNLDHETGIRYGVVNVNRLPYLWDDAEPIYIKACPYCGTELDDDFLSPDACPACGEDVEDGEEYGEEPIGYEVASGGVVASIGTDGDMFILKSPVAIRAQFCSPCAPGAGHVEHPCQNGPLTYALPLDWFDEGDAPYGPDDLVTL